MWFWFKKLVKPRWVVTYDCLECENHFCGECGRGVQEANYFYTKKAALKDAHEWVTSRYEQDDPDYKIVVTEIGGHTTVVMHLKHEDMEADLPVYACVDERSYW